MRRNLLIIVIIMTAITLLPGFTATAGADAERARVVVWARRKASIHHRIAAENQHLRDTHLALSSAYVGVSTAIERGEHWEADNK